jgi:hypothetical protein
LIVDANRELSGAIASENLEAVPRERPEIAKACRSFQTVEPRLRLTRKAGKLATELSRGEIFMRLSRSLMIIRGCILMRIVHCAKRNIHRSYWPPNRCRAAALRRAPPQNRLP